MRQLRELFSRSVALTELGSMVVTAAGLPKKPSAHVFVAASVSVVLQSLAVALVMTVSSFVGQRWFLRWKMIQTPHHQIHGRAWSRLAKDSWNVHITPMGPAADVLAVDDDAVPSTQSQTEGEQVPHHDPCRLATGPTGR